MAVNSSGQYVYQKGDGFGGFVLDLFTRDAANVKQRQQTIRRVVDGATQVASEVVRGTADVVRAPSEILMAGVQAVPEVVRAVAPALPSVARAAAPFVGGVGGAILGALGGRGAPPVGGGASVPMVQPAPAESNNTGLWVGLGALVTVAAVSMSSMSRERK